MTDQSDRRESQSPPRQDESTSDVGYGRPPVHTQFKPGHSGNPNGRPKGTKNKALKLPPRGEERMKAIIMEEAYRTIEVRDGMRSLTISVIQAVIRNMALNAAKGDKRSQGMMTDLLQTTERERKVDAEECFKISMEYKKNWERELRRRKKQGVEAPDPLPHPDDIVLNTETGEFEIRGPMNEEEKDYLTLLDLKIGMETRIPDLEDKAAKTPKNKKVREELASLRSTIAKIKRSLANHPGGGRFAV